MTSQAQPTSPEMKELAELLISKGGINNETTN